MRDLKLQFTEESPARTTSEDLNFNFRTIKAEIERIESSYIKKTHDPVYWDNLCFPSNSISIGGLSSPPGVEPNTGLLLFDSVAAETIGILALMPRSKKIQTGLRPNVHWKKTTNGAGGIAWQMRYRWFNIGELWGAWSSIMTITDDPGTTQIYAVSSFDEIPPPDNETVLSLCLIQFGRGPTDPGDTYGADALLYGFDLNYQKSRIGTETEFA